VARPTDFSQGFSSLQKLPLRHSTDIFSSYANDACTPFGMHRALFFGPIITHERAVLHETTA
jgi:hypothetical protein